MTLEDDYAQRKALLIAQCDLQRLRLQRGLLALRAQAQPHSPPAERAWSAPVAATLLSLALPTWGPQRVQRVLELFQWGLTAFRWWRRWQRSQPGKEPGGVY